MMDDWQKGDLALCIKLGPWQITYGEPAHMRNPHPGCFYTVTRVGDDGGAYGPWITLSGFEPHRYVAHRFRKIRPHTPDAEDAETIHLLTGNPIRERVS